MSKSARRLGRGLDSLVSNLRSGVDTLPGVVVTERSPTIDGAKQEPNAATRVVMVGVGALEPNPYQPRGNISDEGVLSLARSLKRNGLLQPIIARQEGGRLQIVAGERRWRAAKAAGMEQVPVMVRSASNAEMLELALIENIQREDLNAIDRAHAYFEYCTRYGARPEELAERLGEDRSTVVNYVRLLELPDRIRTLVAQGQVSMGHARCLLSVIGVARQTELAEAVARHGLSVRALEEIARREKTRGGEAARVETAKDRARVAHVREVEERFEHAVKTKVTIHEGRRKGSGRIVIEYYSLDDFDRIAEMLGVTLEEGK